VRERLCWKFRATRPDQAQSPDGSVGMDGNPPLVRPLPNGRTGCFVASGLVLGRPAGNKLRSKSRLRIAGHRNAGRGSGLPDNKFRDPAVPHAHSLSQGRIRLAVFGHGCGRVLSVLLSVICQIEADRHNEHSNNDRQREPADQRTRQRSVGLTSLAELQCHG
jgi:hypothetical protein